MVVKDENIKISYLLFGKNILGEYFFEGMNAINQLQENLKRFEIIIDDDDIISFFSDPYIIYKYESIEELVNEFIRFQNLCARASIINKRVDGRIKKQIIDAYRKKTISLNLLNYINNNIWPLIVHKFVKKHINVSTYIKNSENINFCTFTISESVACNIYKKNFYESSYLFSKEFLDWSSYNAIQVNKIEVYTDKILVQL